MLRDSALKFPVVNSFSCKWGMETKMSRLGTRFAFSRSIMLARVFGGDVRLWWCARRKDCRVLYILAI